MNPQISNLSLLLLTHNSSEKIQKYWTWLSQVPSINELIVVDDNSNDDTLDQIKKVMPKNVSLKTYKRDLNDDFSAQRNFGITKASNEWILWLDDDETPSKELLEYLKSFKFDSKYSYAFKRLDYFLGSPLKHGETANQSFIRLFLRGQGMIVHPVHEVWFSELPIKYSDAHILHYSHNTLRGFLEKINFYSSIRAQELFRQKVHSGIFSVICYPKAKFLKNYIFNLGFLDSTPGIIMALGMSFHSFLVRAKLWHLWQH